MIDHFSWIYVGFSRNQHSEIGFGCLREGGREVCTNSSMVHGRLRAAAQNALA